VTLLLRSVFISNYSNSVSGLPFLDQYHKAIKTLERLTDEMRDWRFLVLLWRVLWLAIRCRGLLWQFNLHKAITCTICNIQLHLRNLKMPRIGRDERSVGARLSDPCTGVSLTVAKPTKVGRETRPDPAHTTWYELLALLWWANNYLKNYSVCIFPSFRNQRICLRWSCTTSR
jgi:hypothetical protein